MNSIEQHRTIDTTLRMIMWDRLDVCHLAKLEEPKKISVSFEVKEMDIDDLTYPSGCPSGNALPLGRNSRGGRR